MKIFRIELTVQNLASAVSFYRDVLDMSVDQNEGRAVIRAGSSQLILVEGAEFDGVHHIAFGISPSDFELAYTWLKDRVELIVVDGSAIIVGPDGWNSQSLYFLGPEDIILELIARKADSHVSGGGGVKPKILSISEIGIATGDVRATVKELTDKLGLPTFFSQGAHFAPVGDHDGLLIVVNQGRIWFPTQSLRHARGALKVHLESPGDDENLSVGEQITIATFSMG